LIEKRYIGKEEIPDCEYIWNTARNTLVAVHCVIYETNFLGERRFKEIKKHLN